MTGRADGGKRDRFAVEILDGLDRRIRRHVPIKVRRSGHFARKNADRRAFGKGADGGRNAGRGGDIDAAADEGLDRFRSGGGIEDIEIESVLLENAAALAELGKAGVPGAFLRNGDFERVVGERRRGRCRRAPKYRERAMTKRRMISSRR